MGTEDRRNCSSFACSPQRHEGYQHAPQLAQTKYKTTSGLVSWSAPIEKKHAFSTPPLRWCRNKGVSHLAMPCPVRFLHAVGCVYVRLREKHTTVHTLAKSSTGSATADFQAPGRVRKKPNGIKDNPLRAVAMHPRYSAAPTKPEPH